MTTDIIELAQREKLEAWFKSSFHPDKTGPYIKDQLYFAWKAAGAELVEALEKAQQYAKERDEENQDLMLTIGRLRVEREGLEAIRAAAEKLVRCKGRYHSEHNYRALAALFGVNTPELPPLEHENVHYADAAEMEIAALRQRIAELESRTVKLPEPYAYLRENDGQIQISIGAERPSDRSGGYATPWFPIYTAAGIKVEAE